MRIEDNQRAIEYFWKDPIARTQTFFGKAPFHKVSGKHVDAYQLGIYLSLWGELYGFREDPRSIGATGRGTGKTTIFQELNAADMACFMPYFLQVYYGEKKPIDVTIIFVANVKKGSKQRLEYTKNLIRSNPYLERHLVDYNQWTKEEVVLRNGAMLRAEAASDRARGYHNKHPRGKVVYLFDEFAFWGGIQCMDGQKFTEEIAEQSFGATIGAFTTPYGKRGGAWWAFNNPDWDSFNFPTWMNPRVDKKKLALKVKRLLAQGRQIIVDQEIRGLFVDDAGLWFTMEIWLKSINASLEWEFDDQSNYHSVMRQLLEMENKGVKKHGYYLLGCDPNKGTKRAGADPYGISLTEKVGRKFYNRFTSAYNARSHEEMDRMKKLICKIYNPQKINFDGGGGYATGPIAMLKGSEGTRNIAEIPNSNPSIVGYMSTLRSMMIMGRYEQPPSEDLRESQMAMRSIGDIENIDNYESSDAMIKFQADNKKSGIPCDLAAMGLALARENVTRQEISLTSETKTETGIPKNIETIRVYRDLARVGDLDLEGINAILTGVGA